MLSGLLRRVLGDSAVDTEQEAASSNVKLEARRQKRKSVTWQVRNVPASGIAALRSGKVNILKQYNNNVAIANLLLARFLELKNRKMLFGRSGSRTHEGVILYGYSQVYLLEAHRLSLGVS